MYVRARMRKRKGVPPFWIQLKRISAEFAAELRIFGRRQNWLIKRDTGKRKPAYFRQISIESNLFTIINDWVTILVILLLIKIDIQSLLIAAPWKWNCKCNCHVMRKPTSLSLLVLPWCSNLPDCKVGRKCSRAPTPTATAQRVASAELPCC